jgi:hypothetical protein
MMKSNLPVRFSLAFASNSRFDLHFIDANVDMSRVWFIPQARHTYASLIRVTSCID